MWVASSHRLGPDEMKEKGESLETQAFLSSLSLSLSLYLLFPPISFSFHIATPISLSFLAVMI
jgi:hypothetical protein